jgi:hypothetical protein
VDVSNPAHPFKQSSFDTGAGGIGGQIAVAGDYTHVVGGGRMYVVDISDPIALELIITNNAERACDIAITGGFVYVADGADGLTILQLNDDHQ